MGSLESGFWDFEIPKFGILGQIWDFGVPKTGVSVGFGVFWVLGGIRGAAARGRCRPVFSITRRTGSASTGSAGSTGSRKLSGAARTEVSVGREMWGGGRGVVGLREPPQRSGEGGGRPHGYGAGICGAGIYGAAPHLWVSSVSMGQ